MALLLFLSFGLTAALRGGGAPPPSPPRAPDANATKNLLTSPFGPLLTLFRPGLPARARDTKVKRLLRDAIFVAHSAERTRRTRRRTFGPGRSSFQAPAPDLKTLKLKPRVVAFNARRPGGTTRRDAVRSRGPFERRGARSIGRRGGKPPGPGERADGSRLLGPGERTDGSRRRRGQIFRGGRSLRAGSSAAVGRKRRWDLRTGLSTPPRPGRGESEETSRGDAVGATWIVRGDKGMLERKVNGSCQLG